MTIIIIICVYWTELKVSSTTTVRDVESWVLIVVEGWAEDSF